MKSFKKHRDYGFWDQDIRLSKLSRLGDPLERLNQGVDFEMFREILEDRLTKEPAGDGGRPPYDYVMMVRQAHQPCSTGSPTMFDRLTNHVQNHDPATILQSIG